MLNIQDHKPLIWPFVSVPVLIVGAIIFPPWFVTGWIGYFLVLAVILSRATDVRLDKDVLWLVLPFVLTIAVGLVGGVGSAYRDYFRDVWYFAYPSAVMTTGYVLAKAGSDGLRGIRYFIIAGILVAVFQIIPFAIDPTLLLQTAVEIRKQIGTGYYAPALSVVLFTATAISAISRNGWRWNLRAGLGLVVCVLAIGVMFSRTVWLVLVIGIVGCAAGANWRRWLLAVAAIAVTLAAITIFGGIVDTSSREAQHTFFGKMVRSIDELRIKDHFDIKDVNENWRGYETARALKTYAEGNPFQWLFGRGFGALIDLGLTMRLGGGVGEWRTAYREIPILHNGYAYLLVKGGVFAIVCYLACLWYIARRAIEYLVGTVEATARALAHALVGSIVAIAASTWVIAGAFNKSDMFPFLLFIGYALACIPKDQRVSRQSMRTATSEQCLTTT